MFKNSGPATLLVCMALTGCGGGGADTGGSVMIPGPTPTSEPTSAYNYQLATDFSKDRSHFGYGSRVERFRAYGHNSPGWVDVSAQTRTNVGGGVGFSYQANPKRYQLVYITERHEFTNITSKVDEIWDADQESSSVPLGTSRDLYRGVPTGPLQQDKLRYVGILAWNEFTQNFDRDGTLGDQDIRRFHVYGAPTLVADMPKTPTHTFRLGQSYPFGQIELQMNWNTGEISGTARVPCPADETCPNGDLGEAVFTAIHEGGDRILGTVTGSAGYSGTIVGNFYGPVATEIGIVGDLHHATRRKEIFFALGKR